MSEKYDSNFTVLASKIVAAYVSHNPVPASEIAGLIQGVHRAVANLAAGGEPAVDTSAAGVRKASATQIRKSVQPSGIVSFIDGRTYKTLKRHLSANGLDPRSYRERFGLPMDYPMVAPGYAEQRSALAKAIGLGRPSAMAYRATTDHGGTARWGHDTGGTHR
ncbi:MucR family transcriptional regulator [Methylobacterium sp. C1]|uniref:MucR family transcriptional regulator n=1 Tax=Methylobacterium sp. C1 TaxID=1479019 RepID=UPI0008DA2A2B|nr:MucR family transcriptional regulator [Methylobacterium sp. C1]